MKSLLENLTQALAATSNSVRIMIGLALLAIVGVAGYSGYRASNPHFEVLYGNLDANTASQMTAALAGANIRFQLSQPPGPHVLYVEAGSQYQAQNAIALSGASTKSPTGIQTTAEGSSVFDGANERAQKSMKREWEEMEKQLNLLSFVSNARVTTSVPDRSPFRRDKRPTVAVTLALRGGEELTKAQATTVAKLVRFRFDVPSENVIISDQFGNSLYDGPELAGPGGSNDVLDNRMRFEKELQAKANRVLDKVLGDGAAYVVVNSEWSYEQRETVRESYDPTATVDVSKETEKTTTPVGSNNDVGGPVGSASNVPGALGNATATAQPAPASSSSEATTKSESTRTIAGKETEHRLSHMPQLQRMSISLFLDESLDERQADLASSVQAAVGFVETRDAFATFVTPFASLERDEQGNLVKPEPAPPLEEPSQVMGLLFEHGIEIIAALGFLFVLMKALKSDPKAQVAAATGGAPGSPVAEAEPQLSEEELERLAIAQVEELVKTEPERVSEILSAWALEDLEQAKAGA